jgi:hypothetical protein
MYVRGGSGGQGAATFKLVNGRQKGLPDGGSGGRGGDVVFVCDGKINTLQVCVSAGVCGGVCVRERERESVCVRVSLFVCVSVYVCWRWDTVDRVGVSINYYTLCCLALRCVRDVDPKTIKTKTPKTQAFRGRASFHAENGKDGQNQFKNGASGRGVEVKVRARWSGLLGSG